MLSHCPSDRGGLLALLLQCSGGGVEEIAQVISQSAGRGHGINDDQVPRLVRLMSRIGG
jgi:hypothetical protein